MKTDLGRAVTGDARSRYHKIPRDFSKLGIQIRWILIPRMRQAEKQRSLGRKSYLKSVGETLSFHQDLISPQEQDPDRAQWEGVKEGQGKNRTVPCQECSCSTGGGLGWVLAQVQNGRLSSKHLLNAYSEPRMKCYSRIISFNPIFF